MTYEINETHDPNLRSWVESANAPDTDFPIQNLPLCAFRHQSNDAGTSIGVVIGDKILDLGSAAYVISFSDIYTDEIVHGDLFHPLVRERSIERFLQEGSTKLSKMRNRLSEVLREDAPPDGREALARCLVPINEASFLPPFEIGDYTDFYCSIFHATNVGSMFRPDNPLLPNYKYVPIGYHGRASSIVVSGMDIRRPKGQNRSDAEQPPVYIPCKNLDYELEVGFFVGKGNQLGETIPLARAEEHIFGLCLVNDWSARDVQAWEYQPLGPFLAKNFATSISPFVVTMEALAPFRAPAFARPEGDPQPLPHLYTEENERTGGFDVKLEVLLRTARMREENAAPHLVSRSNMRDLYWTIGQMLTHHASNGCNLQTGDLMATGTISGRGKEERGCLLELTWRGTEPLALPTGETRRFLEDGDEVIFRGYCEREGFRRIGFGECRGVILPST